MAARIAGEQPGRRDPQTPHRSRDVQPRTGAGTPSARLEACWRPTSGRPANRPSARRRRCSWPTPWTAAGRTPATPWCCSTGTAGRWPRSPSTGPHARGRRRPDPAGIAAVEAIPRLAECTMTDSRRTADPDHRLEEVLAGYLQPSKRDSADRGVAGRASRPGRGTGLVLRQPCRIFAPARRSAPPAPAPRGGDRWRGRTDRGVPAVGDSLRYFGDYELLEEIAPRRHGRRLQGAAGQPQPRRRAEDDPGRPARVGG